MTGAKRPELDLKGQLRPAYFPGVTRMQPVVGHLDLLSVDNFLVEDTELIADPVTDSRNLRCSQRIQVTGRQPAQATMTEPGFLFFFE